MSNVLEPIPVASDQLLKKPTTDLRHLPGPKGHWLFGNLKAVLPNPGPFLREMQKQYGNCFTVGMLRNRRIVIMMGPAASQLLLTDPDNNFSTRLGWDIILEYFGRNILVRDFEDHKLHRRLLTPVFKVSALAGYLQQMNPIIAQTLQGWQGQQDVYQVTKQLTLDLALQVFAGFAPGSQTMALNRDLSTVLNGAMAQKINFPGTTYYKGLRARDRLLKVLHATLPEKRQYPGTDLFSRLANLEEDGQRLSDQDVIDHMMGILFASHDTTASVLSMMLLQLSQHPEWVAALVEETHAVFEKHGDAMLPYAALSEMPRTESFCKEILRLYSPLQFFPRRCVNPFEFEGHTLPANSPILMPLQSSQLDENYFPAPEKLDPWRFMEEDKISPFAYIPFGRGKHMCLGMHFAMMEIKAVIYQLFRQYRLTFDSSQQTDIGYMPIVRPIHPVQVEFIPE